MKKIKVSKNYNKKNIIHSDKDIKRSQEAKDIIAQIHENCVNLMEKIEEVRNENEKESEF